MVQPLFKAAVFVLLSVTPLSAFSRTGPSDGGGGDLLQVPTKKITIEQFRCMVSVQQQNHFGLDRFRIRLGVVADQAKGKQRKALDQLFAKLYIPSYENDLEQISMDIEFEIKESGACVTKDGLDRDGTASLRDGAAPKVCLSFERLNEKLYPERWGRQLTALIIHEASHLKGTSEEEAVYLQMLAESWTDVISNPRIEAKDGQCFVRDYFPDYGL